MQKILLFPGGGALGAFQAGIYEAMDQSDMMPDWIVGTSIGAINGAIIAGNPPPQRLEKLRSFWHQVAFTLVNGRLDLMLDNPMGERLMSYWSIMTAFAYGLGGFFKPRTMRAFAMGFKTSPQNASFYTTHVLEDTLKAHVDFDYLKKSPVRLSVGAVDIQSSEMAYFDSTQTTLTAEHIMASGALPPAFPPVEIAGRFYWDGGVYSNTPLEWVLRHRPTVPSLCLQSTLWQKQGDLPTDLAGVLRRSRELQYGSRDQTLVRQAQTNHELRNLIETLATLIPAQVMSQELRKTVTTMAGDPVLHLVSMEAPRIDGETHNKHLDFSASRVQQRWVDGHLAGKQALSAAPWEKPVSERAGIVVHLVSQST